MSRFNPPPGWPVPPPGWTPPSGWSPDPSWPPPPPGWSFWTEEVPQPSVRPQSSVRPSQQGPEHIQPSDGSKQKRALALFGGPRKADLETEVEELRATLGRMNALPAVEIEHELHRARHELEATRQELDQAKAQLAGVRAQIVETNEIAQLQEAGVYDYAHPLSDAVAYKDLLARVKADTKALVSAGRAVAATTNWQVNGSAAQGRKMVSDFSKALAAGVQRRSGQLRAHSQATLATSVPGSPLQG